MTIEEDKLVPITLQIPASMLALLREHAYEELAGTLLCVAIGRMVHDKECLTQRAADDAMKRLEAHQGGAADFVRGLVDGVTGRFVKS